jgi:hypothetical protein
MKIKEYIKFQMDKKIELKIIYNELLRIGYKPKEIYITINEIIVENISKAIEDYNKKKNEK